MNEKIAIIGTVGVPACYGGFETLVENLLTDSPVEMVVYCSSKSYSERKKMYKNAKLHYVPLSANGSQSVMYDIFSMIHGLSKGYRQFLVLGVSGALIFPLLKLLMPKIKLVTNIDGLEWRRNKWGSLTKKFLKFSEKIAVKYSDKVVSDNKAIFDYVQEEYGVISEVIAYGGDHCLISNLPNTCGKYFLGLCRIEPENNIHLILEAVSNSQAEIVFVGNWDNSSYRRSLKSKYANFKNITLLDPIYNTEELFKLRAECRGYVHGHSAGGTNPSLVEMMFFEKPIIAFDCSYNRATMEDEGAYFSSSTSLKEILDSNLDDDSAKRLKEVAERRYTWSVVRQQYYNLFK